MPAATGNNRPYRAAAVLMLAACGAIVAAAPSPAVTRFQRSLYSAIDPGQCQEAASPASDGRAYICPGLPGYPVYYAEANDHAYLGFGTSPQFSKAASQSLSAANTLKPRSGRRITIEWRVVIRNGRNVPYAAIVRAFTSDKGERGQVLIVFRIAGGEACHDAYVDALANPQPIVLAHDFADEGGRTFDCSAPARVLGETGVSPM